MGENSGPLGRKPCMGVLFPSPHDSAMFKVLLLVSLLALSVCATQNQVFAWSNNINGNNQILDTVYSSDISALLRVAGAEGTTNKFSNFFSAPADVSVLFLAQSKLTQLSSVKDSLSVFAGSLSIPYGHFTQEASVMLSQIMKEKNTFVIGEMEGAQSIEMEDALELIQRGTDRNVLIIVPLAATVAESNELISAFNKVSAGRSVTLMAMDVSPSSTESIEFPAAKKAHQPAKQVLSYGETAPYETRFPAYVIEGLLVSFFLVFIALVGVYCSCAIQTPDSFETPHKHRD